MVTDGDRERQGGEIWLEVAEMMEKGKNFFQMM